MPHVNSNQTVNPSAEPWNSAGPSFTEAENQLNVGAAGTAFGVGLIMRNIANTVFAPTLIAALMFAFLSFTFATAKVLIYLSGDPRLSSLLATWAVITVATVVLLRQVPRLFER